MISSVLQYSTTDFRFLQPNIEQLSQVSDEIIIPICDHLFNGQPENETVLKKSYELLSKYDKVQVVEFEWAPGYHTRYWHNAARAIGVNCSSEKANWILFVDTDEIIDASAFNKWIKTNEYEQYDSIKLSNYWYFREPTYQAAAFEDSVVMVRKQFVQFDLMHPTAEREQCHELLNIRKKRQTKGTDDLPMVHHYSWVRSKQEMLTKVSSWGHNNDKNWADIIEEEFNRPFNGTDFVHGYQYNFVENKFKV